MNWKVEVEEVVKAKVYKASFYDANGLFINDFTFEATSFEDAEKAIREANVEAKK
ncbi:hypothetical protein AAHR76_001662 [Yersinia enterocolitica]|nr:hypothetical protein [Yersinia enterocolitica]